MASKQNRTTTKTTGPVTRRKPRSRDNQLMTATLVGWENPNSGKWTPGLIQRVTTIERILKIVCILIILLVIHALTNIPLLQLVQQIATPLAQPH